MDEELARQARRFVETFNALFGERLPAPEPACAKTYWLAYEDNEILGRCVRIGRASRAADALHYHWAITRAGGILTVDAFWDAELWTTERYKSGGRRVPAR